MKTPQVFECVKLDKKRGNIVLSRRSILEKKTKPLKKLEELRKLLEKEKVKEHFIKKVKERDAYS